ncbi:molybdenum cofactor guanylyltransferase [Nocardiopsis sinuspersici]|uniref:Molybdenum cofactor guanylyltransferase n=1 Tax=Nocardiopsis sinuspersici TaxID=501010 RepID=A0A1V3BY83_9ACTN|nr:molybdenum cofactor guanylyltransferase [Nocardiopsis sinuspersici]
MVREVGAPLDAVVLAGGAGRRMGGVDKPGLDVAGRTLLERVTDVVRAHNADAVRVHGAGTVAPSGTAAVGATPEDARDTAGSRGEAGEDAGGGRTIVVGPTRESPRALYVREDPPGSGPVPALRAGLAHVRTPWFALLAADLPHLDTGHLAALTAALSEDDAGAVFVDSTGHEQWLTGVWRADAVRAALADYRGRSLYRLLGPLRPRAVPPADDLAVADCDTPEDLDRARRLLEPPAG